MLLSKVIEGYLLDASARRLSPYTIADYSVAFRKLTAALGDMDFEAVSVADVTRFLAEQPVGEKTLLNYHIGLSSLWTWAVSMGLAKEHVVRQVRRPRPNQVAVKPFTRQEVRAMLKATERSEPYQRLGQATMSHALTTSLRNRAILLLMMDTGIRAGEVVALDIADIDFEGRTLMVRKGKGRKSRELPLSARTSRAIWKYVAQDGRKRGALFLSSRGQRLRRDSLSGIVKKIGVRARVDHAHAHRFRHTFAIEFLRNGGNIFSLQRILGHSTIDMVRRYLAISQADIVGAHRGASPVAEWHL